MKPSSRSFLWALVMLTLASLQPCLAATPADGLAALPAALPSVQASGAAASPAASVIAQEARAFAQRIKSGELAVLPDEAVLKAFRALQPETLAAYLELGARPFNEYELWLTREERLGGQWPAKPCVNHIKYRQQPRQVYMKWLDGGAKAGQEIIYDETRRKGEMYGHIGGAFNVMSVWTSLTGSMARANSNHSVNELGVQAMVAIVVADRALYAAEGRRPLPASIELARLKGQRTVAVTWVASSPQHYAHKTTVYLDLQQPLMRGIEAWAEDGNQTERIVLDKIVPATFTDADFDPGNPAYKF
jgi:hypothetical protein